MPCSCNLQFSLGARYEISYNLRVDDYFTHLPLFFLHSDIPASAMYFGSYEWLQNVLTPEGKS